MTRKPSARRREDALETDCVAGHIGFEPANPSASYLIEIACLIDGEVVCCDERGVAAFPVLRRRQNEASAFL